MAQRRDRNAVIQRSNGLVLAVHEPQRHTAARGLRNALQHMHVGREVSVLGEDDLAIWPQRQRMGHGLELVEGGGVTHHHRAGRSADQRRNAVAQQRGHLQPLPLAPAAAAQMDPVVQQAPGLLAHSRRHGADRVGIHVDGVVRTFEERANGREIVLGIKGLRQFEGGGCHGRELTTAPVFLQ